MEEAQRREAERAAHVAPQQRQYDMDVSFSMASASIGRRDKGDLPFLLDYKRICTSVCVSGCFVVWLSVCPRVSVSLCFSVSLYLCVFVSPCLCGFVSLCLHVFLSLCRCEQVSLCLCLCLK